MYQIMTPGPTEVPENVRMARSTSCTNPDLDPEFYDFYRETAGQISSLVETEGESLILSGEGILGLEAVCATLTEPGDRVLVLDNGVFGRGFQDFVTIYGGKPVLYTTDYKKPIDPAALEDFLSEDHAYKYATLVHCDTPSGMLNDVGALCPVLKKYGILTVVDSVSAMFGNPLHMDAWRIDFLCGGSQKALSAPPGLTFVSISRDGRKAMEERKTPVASFYANLKAFDGWYEKQWFPYTMPISDIYGLRAALENLREDTDLLGRHRRIAEAVRSALVRSGLGLHLEDGFSDTVSVFDVPEGMQAKAILDTMLENYQIMLAGSFDVLAGQVIRIGHMGNNAREDKVQAVMRALDGTFKRLGHPLSCSLEKAYLESLAGTDSEEQ